jgi:hypothetical protein
VWKGWREEEVRSQGINIWLETRFVSQSFPCFYHKGTVTLNKGTEAIVVLSTRVSCSRDPGVSSQTGGNLPD